MMSESHEDSRSGSVFGTFQHEIQRLSFVQKMKLSRPDVEAIKHF